MVSTLKGFNLSKMAIYATLALVTAVLIYALIDINTFAQASSAFDKVKVGNQTVGSSKNLDQGLFKDMNTILMIFLSIAGFVVIACLIFAGVKLATAQGNPQNRTQGFIGLGMAILGGWVVYKALDLAGWIKGISGS